MILDQNPPRLIIVMGTSGVGKTTFSRKLTAQITDSIVVDKDTLNVGFWWKSVPDAADPLAEYLVQPCDRDSAYYAQYVKPHSYHCMFLLAADNLACHKHVIIDAPFVKEMDWGYFDVILPKERARMPPHVLKLLHCYVGEEELKRRTIGRSLPRDRQRLSSDEEWRRFLARDPIMPERLHEYRHCALSLEEDHFSGENGKSLRRYLCT